MTVCAIANSIPADCDYLTAGREYEVIKDKFLKDDYFVIIADDGADIVAKWNGCWFLNGGNWLMVER